MYSFTGRFDGAIPSGALLRDAAGNLYGTAEQGGTFSSTCPLGCGVVFRVSSEGIETVLYRFSGGADGNHPLLGLVRDSTGDLYGVTSAGGITSSCLGYGGAGVNGCGVVFKVSRIGSEAVLYSFTGGTDGASPNHGLTRDAAGNVYGTTGGGGDVTSCSGFGCGVVFKLDASGNETPLYSFTGGADGLDPDSTLTLDAAGNIYGTAGGGGNSSCEGGNGCGVVFEVNSSGNETTLYSFSGPDGEVPVGGLARDASGNLYGVTEVGGTYGDGTIFKLSPSGKETLLHSFSNSDGALPLAGLSSHNGVFYGTTASGGFDGLGVAFQIFP